MTRLSVLIGTGSALPRRALGNAELAKMVDTNDEWIVSRSGIRERHIENGLTNIRLHYCAVRTQLCVGKKD